MTKIWNNLHYWQRGFLIGMLAFPIYIIYRGVRIIIAYNGLCGGGILPWLGESARECSLTEYFVRAIGWIAFPFGWPFILLEIIFFFVLIPCFAGYLIGRLKEYGSKNKLT